MEPQHQKNKTGIIHSDKLLWTSLRFWRSLEIKKLSFEVKLTYQIKGGSSFCIRFTKRWCLCLWCRLNTLYLWVKPALTCGFTRDRNINSCICLIHPSATTSTMFVLYTQSPDTQNVTLLFVLKAIRKSKVVLCVCRSKWRQENTS